MRNSIAMLALAVTAAVVLGVYVHLAMERNLLIDAGHLVYDVPRGANIRSVSADLEARRIIAVPGWVFRLYARVTRDRGELKAGEYELSPGMSAAGMLAMFRAGRVVQREITFVEGLTFAQWRRLLDGRTGIEHVTEGESGRDIMKALGDPDVSPEGQFFPDTYHYTKGESDLSILRRAHRRMVDTLQREWRNASDAAAYASPQQALIVASMIEKETGYAPDRPKVARVFLNRLSRHMKLQSDPTIIYGLKDFDGDLTKADLSVPSPYNTYLATGLPPTPICNPGLDSIRAALNPDPGDYYYFVARGDGSSEFSRTLAQHNRAVARFQKAGRVENYRSAPSAK